ncbi:MAG: YidH family protein [Vicinamibacterales bacterium]
MSPAPQSAPSSLDLARKRTDLAAERTKDALIRTRIAYERTLMAWVRTATSLIAFGFTIYTFFQHLRENTTTEPSERLLDPGGVALVMIGLGVAALALATFEHRRNMKELQAHYSEYGPIPRSLAAGVATVVAGLGVLGLVLVFLRL